MAHSAIIDIDDVAHCLIAFAKEAMKPIGCNLELEVDRNTDFLKQMLRKYKNPGFDITKHLSIEFKDEMGLDAGGVTREYFHLLMERLKQGPGGAINLFEGQLGHLVPIHNNYDVLSGALFVLSGKMILHSILNDCNGVPGMSPAIISYLMTGRRDSAVEHVTLEDIPDPDLKEKLQELLCCKEDSLENLSTRRSWYHGRQPEVFLQHDNHCACQDVLELPSRTSKRKFSGSNERFRNFINGVVRST